jgi:hypothetical protein
MYNIVCVLKTGKWTHPGYPKKTAEYGANDVLRLKKQVEKHCSAPHRFICLSDIEIPGVETLKLRHNWPGWWSKMELFDRFTKAFYLDLDSAVVGEITDLVTRPAKKFQVLKNLSSPTSVRIGSGVMKWEGDYSYLYEEFKKRAEENMAEFTTPEWWGDQGFIRAHLEDWEHLQHIWPGAIVSYNRDMKKQGDPPLGSKIVCFHGETKPLDVLHKHDWILQ